MSQNPLASKPQSGRELPAWCSLGPGALLALTGILALAFAVFLPPFQKNDEHAHFLRAYEISVGHIAGEPDFLVPAGIASVIQRYPEALEGRNKIRFSAVVHDVGRPSDMQTMVKLPADDEEHKYLQWGILGTNLYCPVTYLPASAGIAAARLVGASPLAMLYAARIGNVLAFLAALAIVFRLAPEYRLLFAAMALLPMTLHQAGGVSADAVTVAVSFLGTACLLWLRENQANWKALALIALTFAVWAICKSNPWVVVAVLLIPRGRFTSWRSWVLYMCAVWAAMGASMWIWQGVSHENVKALATARLTHGIDMAANTRFVVTHPMAFLSALISFCRDNGREYIGQFSASFGWTRWGLTNFVRYPYLLLIAVVAATERSSKEFSWKERALMVAAFAAGVVFLHAVLFISDGTVCGADLCFTSSAGIQGRYFMPFAPFLFLAIRQKRFTLPYGALAITIAAAGTVYAMIALRAIKGHYYQ